MSEQPQPVDIPVDVNEIIDAFAEASGKAQADLIILRTRMASATKVIANQQAQIEELERLVRAARDGAEERDLRPGPAEPAKTAPRRRGGKAAAEASD